MRQTKLKRSSRGFVRNLGKFKDGKGWPKFCLGHDKEAAEMRFAAIVKLWEQCQAQGFRSDDFLAAARAVARGESCINVPAGDRTTFRSESECCPYPAEEKIIIRVGEPAADYSVRVAALKAELKSLGVDVEPAEPDFYAAGRADFAARIAALESGLRTDSGRQATLAQGQGNISCTLSTANSTACDFLRSPFERT